MRFSAKTAIAYSPRRDATGLTTVWTAQMSVTVGFRVAPPISSLARTGVVSNRSFIATAKPIALMGPMRFIAVRSFCFFIFFGNRAFYFCVFFLRVSCFSCINFPSGVSINQK